MTAKRYSVEGNWIKDNWIDKLLNIDFNALDDAILCCDLLNDPEDKKLENGEIATQLLKENEQLKTFREQNINEYNKLKKQCNGCKLENEQLKQFIDEIYKKFEDKYGMSIENTDWF